MEISVKKEISDESGDESGDEVFFEPPEICETAESANSRLLPVKSREKYEAAYLTYTKWRKSNDINLTSENVLKTYFKELSEKYKPPTLWSTWSMLKSTINTSERINISEYKQLTDFLKRESRGYKAKKSKVLSSQEIQKFLKQAPGNKYLATKVALIFGICGACKTEELANIKVTDIKHQGDILVVKIHDTRTKIPRSFIIEDEFFKIVKLYESLRPPNTISDRFFLNYQNGKCTSQVIGRNKFGAMPKQIAQYLHLPDPHLYTGHSFRRTSATLLANSGTDSIMLKRHCNWKSSTVSEDCMKDSIDDKQQIARIITSPISMDSSTSDERSKSDVPPLKKIKEVNIVVTTSENLDGISDSTIIIKNNDKNPLFQFHNCNVNIHYHK